MHPLRPILTLTLLPSLLACQRLPATTPPGSDSGPTTIHIDPQPLHINVKRLGINLSGQTFYDSGQLLRNLTFRNPGFEGETWQSILHCKLVTPNTCTDENQYAQWPRDFLSGAQYEIISGAGTNTRGTVRTSLPAVNNQGVTLELSDSPKGLAAGDFLLIRIAKPGGAEAGWWKDLKGGATLSSESQDLSPNTPGRQALRIDARASGAVATVSSFFDSFAGRSFVQLRGRYTLSFRAKALTGASSVIVDLQRLDTTHGLHSFFHREVPLTSGWHDYTFTFEAKEKDAGRKRQRRRHRRP